MDSGVASKDLRARVWLSLATSPGDRVVGALVQECGPRLAAQVVAKKRSPQELRHTGLSAEELTTLVRRRTHIPSRADVDQALWRCSVEGITLIDRSSQWWPVSLNDLGPHQPLLLALQGDPRFLSKAPLTAVVGTRKPSRDGAHSAHVFSEALVARGHTVVSGGALGIDAISHRAAVRAGAPTVAVVATGLDRSYPREHRGLFRAIAQRGAVVSEVLPSAELTPASFLARNRIIAALSQATIVVEAPVRSGALSTASHAATLGRELFAVDPRVATEHNAGFSRLVDEWAARPLALGEQALADEHEPQIGTHNLG